MQLQPESEQPITAFLPSSSSLPVSLPSSPFPSPFPSKTTKRILTSPELLSKQELPSTYTADFIKQFELIAGKQNLFPILFQIFGNFMYVCSKDCFIIMNAHTQEYEKVRLPEMPTSFRGFGQFLYFGLKNGVIIVYNITTKTTLATIQQFSFPVLQIQIVDKNTILAMDSYGNLKVVALSIKVFLQRVVKISSSATDIIQQYRIKKRDKLKNLVKSFSFSLKQPQPQQQGQQRPEPASSSQSFPKFAIYSAYNSSSSSSSVRPLIYYHNNQLISLPLNSSLNGQPVALQSKFVIHDNVPNIGILQLGQGSFTNSNQVHTVLVVSIDKRVLYYRMIQVEDILQFIMISEKELQSNIIDGKFGSNGLVIFLTQNGVEVGNINGGIQIMHAVSFTKFGYLDFFNEEEGFNFDKRILFRNIFKVGLNQTKDCVWGCLQGKRIISGKILHWKNYLQSMSNQLQWEKCMKCALMIYTDKITILAGIPQRVQQRNQVMKQTFEKITLTYLSYQLRKSQNPLQKSTIIKNAIDFMVRTQSFSYLFSTIFQAVASYGLQHNFMQQLQEYVQSGSIKYMNQQILWKVIAHYTSNHSPSPSPSSVVCSKQIDQLPTLQLASSHSMTQIYAQRTLSLNRQHLETMIMNFDLTIMQKPLLLTICLNNQLYQSLIHICKEQNDYVTPILKICGLRIAKMTQLEKMQKEGHVKTAAKITEDMQRLSQIIFYYLYQCLRGHMTEHNNNAAYLDMLQQIIGFVFIPSSFLMLLQASSQWTFKILNVVFGAQVMQYILQNTQSLTVKSCKYTLPNLTSIQSPYQPESEPSLSLAQILQQQLQTPQLWYFSPSNSLLSNTSVSTPASFFSIFNPINHSEQFSLYNNILSIVTHTILQNYKNYHKNQQKDIVTVDKQCVLGKKDKIDENCQKQNNGKKSIIMQEEVAHEKENEKQKHEAELQLYLCHKFIAHLILSNSFPIRIGWKILIFQFMIVYPFAFLERNQRKTSRESIQVVESQNGLQISDHEIQVVNQLIIRIVDSIIRQASKKSLQSPEPILELLVFILQQAISCSTSSTTLPLSQLFLPTKFHLQSSLPNPLPLIQTLLSSSKRSNKYSIFTYFNNKIDQIDNSQEGSKQTIKQLLKILKKLAKDIGKIDEKKMGQILREVVRKAIQRGLTSIGEIMEIAGQIQEFVEIWLGYVESVIAAYEKIMRKEGRQNEENLGVVQRGIQMLSIKHLEMVVAHKNDKLQHYMLKMNYPLEEAYKACEQSNNKTAMAYIMIKSGRNIEGVLMICDLFIANSREVFRDLAKNVQNANTSSLIEKMAEQLNKILETCAHQYNNDIVKGEEMWQKVSQKLFKQLKPKVIDTIPIAKIKQLLQLYIDKIIKAIFGQVNPQFFIYKFSQNAKISGFPTHLYLQAHDLVFQRLGFNYQINSLTKQLLQKNEMKLNIKILKCYSQGNSLSLETQICSKCNQLLKNKKQTVQQQKQQQQIKNVAERIVVFNCGHIYHKNCQQELRQQLKNKNPKKILVNCCLKCRQDWQNLIYGQLKMDPDRYTLGLRERKKSILIQRKKKLMQFDSYESYKAQEFAGN